MAKQLEKMNCSVLEDHDNRPATAEPAPQPPATRRKERPNLSAPQEDTWSPESIRILLDVWASSDIQSMRIAGKKLRNICKGIANRLQMQGVQCSWVQCRNMMLSLEDMYWSIQEANQNKQGDPIIHPFHEGLEKVLPFIYACPEGHKDEPKVYEPSGAYSWKPTPTWTAPWRSQVPPQEMARNKTSISHIENRQTVLNTPQEPPQAKPSTPRHFIHNPRHMTAGNTPQHPSMTPPCLLIQTSQENLPQSVPQGVPWIPGPPIFRPNHLTQENIFHYPTQVYVQHLGTQDSPQEQPQEIPPTAAPLINTNNEESCENTHQSLPLGVPWTFGPPIFRPSHLTQENIFHYPPQTIPNLSLPFSCVQHKWTQDRPQEQPQEIPPTAAPLANMDNKESCENTPQDLAQGISSIVVSGNKEEAGEETTQDQPEKIPSTVTYLFNMDHEEQVGNTSQDPAAEIPQTAPTNSSVLNEESSENTPTQEPPQISYSQPFYIPNQQIFEYFPPCPSPLPLPNGPVPFFYPPWYFFPNHYV